MLGSNYMLIWYIVCANLKELSLHVKKIQDSNDGIQKR